MLKIILATHCHMAEGMKSSLEKILGSLPNVLTVNAYETEESVATQFAQAMQQLAPDDVCLVCTDLFGGSVNQTILQAINLDRVFLFSGVNLPFLLEVLLMEESTITEASLRQALQIGKDQLVYGKDVLEGENSGDDF